MNPLDIAGKIYSELVQGDLTGWSEETFISHVAEHIEQAFEETRSLVNTLLFDGNEQNVISARAKLKEWCKEVEG